MMQFIFQGRTFYENSVIFSFTELMDDYMNTHEASSPSYGDLRKGKLHIALML